MNNEYSASELSRKLPKEVPPTVKLPVPNHEILKRLNTLKQLYAFH